MVNQDIALMAHLMRRAGFGATRDELETLVAKGYEATVNELLNPEGQEAVDKLDLQRYQGWTWKPGTLQGMGAAEWMYFLLNTKRPLEEKMTLFWHQVFATGVSKVDHYDELMDQTDLFRQMGMGNYRELLLAMAKDPAMIYWLDNNENHKSAVNENWGRELLELFSMGVGNYTEVDVRESSRAFTGWTITPKLPRFPMGRFDWEFKYNSADHDNDEKTFLGETGNFNGEDIIDIVCQHPATAQFIARHLYNFFVADEAQVPAWPVTPPKDQDAIDLLADTFTESGYDMTAVLRVLFNSEFFKNARFARLKSPTEVIIGTLRLVGGAEFPAPGLGELARQPSYMGQDLLNPPSVEGWHTGAEWINSGSLMRRVNYTAELIGDTSRPGIQSIIARLKAQGTQSPQQIVENCLDLLGPLDVNPESMTELTGFVGERGDFDWDSAESTQTSTERVGELLQLIVSLREYQYA
ncbi:MAG: DUF1800 domain-containing protein [Chloroflexi bacterium]|nr:DUF1800 domain-containing protein [Chloroflexota bacterium]MCI0845926.1 DUF1800 domain-containing protein [Chloroflexota bacterium]